MAKQYKWKFGVFTLRMRNVEMYPKRLTSIKVLMRERIANTFIAVSNNKAGEWRRE